MHRQEIFVAEEKRLLQKTHSFAIISAYIARPAPAGQDENGLMNPLRELPVGARQTGTQPIRSSHAAGEESAERRPLQRSRVVSRRMDAASFAEAAGFDRLLRMKVQRNAGKMGGNTELFVP